MRIDSILGILGFIAIMLNLVYAIFTPFKMDMNRFLIMCIIILLMISNVIVNIIYLSWFLIILYIGLSIFYILELNKELKKVNSN